MMTIYSTRNGCLTALAESAKIDDASVWIDLLNPTEGEDKLVEQALGIEVPTRSEMREIEASSRFYTEGDTVYMTAIVLHNSATGQAMTSVITFILSGHRLITVRYAEPRGVAIFAARAGKGSTPCGNGQQILIGLLEMLIEREADLIERIQDEVERIAPLIFGQRGTDTSSGGRRLDVILRTVGKEGDIVARAQESAMSLNRTLLYAASVLRARGNAPDVLARIETASQDINSLTESLRFLSDRTTFLLDATLGVISNEQNQIIKLFSVMAVMMMPPTLVASIYGMNFKHMPELDWPFGYPLALGLMFLSGLIPFLYFRRKGWL